MIEQPLALGAGTVTMGPGALNKRAPGVASPASPPLLPGYPVVTAHMMRRRGCRTAHIECGRRTPASGVDPCPPLPPPATGDPGVSVSPERLGRIRPEGGAARDCTTATRQSMWPNARTHGTLHARWGCGCPHPAGQAQREATQRNTHAFPARSQVLGAPPIKPPRLRLATRHGKKKGVGFAATRARAPPRDALHDGRPAAADGGFFALATASDKLAALPCRFHPLLRQLDDDVAALRLVIGQSPPSTVAPTASSVSAAASQVCRVLVSLSNLLHHPQAQEPLRRLARCPPLAERLLDDFLVLADAHGSFRQALVALASLQAETHAALRRRAGDPARLGSASRAQRRAGRDLTRLASAVRAVASKPPLPLPKEEEDLPGDTAALAAAVVDATVAVASGSAAVFSGLATLSNSAASARVEVASTPCWATVVPAKLAGSSSSDAPRTGHHHRIWWVADLVRWMSRAKRRSAEKHNGGGGDEDDESSTVQLRSEARMKPEERARRAALELHENLERCIASVDGSGEKVFRALVNTRVSLLNILSPSF
ncbi:hypothetical protein HU200_060701 [Digitaria exilis]|uniref:Uncharacterized protein n=1 Tax=Digitaria exilis TaxID=1010633 RepID=A0A835A9T7_9POAL|nr:hypothetical protein HU200_060701 [Digitaria exilis]